MRGVENENGVGGGAIITPINITGGYVQYRKLSTSKSRSHGLASPSEMGDVHYPSSPNAVVTDWGTCRLNLTRAVVTGGAYSAYGTGPALVGTKVLRCAGS